jgi:hypothetical protein
VVWLQTLEVDLGSHQGLVLCGPTGHSCPSVCLSQQEEASLSSLLLLTALQFMHIFFFLQLLEF